MNRTTMEPQEKRIILEGPDHFLDTVYETVEGHIQRTGSEYGQIITGVGGQEAPQGNAEEDTLLDVYVMADIEVDEAIEMVNLALDRIAEENDMELARQSVQLTVEDEEASEEA